MLPNDLVRCAVGDEPLLTVNLIHDNLALHTSVAQSASVATLKRVCARRLRQKFNRSCLSLLKLPAVPRRRKNQTSLTPGFSAVGLGPDFEAMIVVDGGDFELNLAP